MGATLVADHAAGPSAGDRGGGCGDKLGPAYGDGQAELVEKLGVIVGDPAGEEFVDPRNLRGLRSIE